MVPTGKDRLELRASFGYLGITETKFKYGLGGEAFVPNLPQPKEVDCELTRLLHWGPELQLQYGHSFPNE